MNMKVFFKANWIPIVFSLFGIVNPILIGLAIKDFEAAFTYALHDPGKTIFHIIIMPSTISIYLRNWAKYDLINLYRKIDLPRKLSFILISVVIVFSGLIFTYQHENFTRCQIDYKSNAFLMPQDFQHPDTVKKMIEIRTEIYQILGAEVRSDDPNLLESLRSRRKSLMVSYKHASTPSVGGCSIITEGTFASVWGLFLTLQGVTFVGLLLCSVFLVLVSDVNNKNAIDQLIIIVAMLAPWLVLRIYSEAYINFIRVDGDILMGVIVLLIVLIILITISIFYRDMKVSKVKRTIFLYGGISGFISLTVALKKEAVIVPFMFVYKTSPAGAICLFFVLLLPLFISMLRPISDNPEVINEGDFE